MRVSGGDLCTKCRSTDRAGRRDQVLLPLPKQQAPLLRCLLFLYVQKMKTRHAERVEGCGSPVETSARSAEAPTEPAGETKSFCPCQKNSHRFGDCFLDMVNFLLQSIFRPRFSQCRIGNYKVGEPACRNRKPYKCNAEMRCKNQCYG